MSLTQKTFLNLIMFDILRLILIKSTREYHFKSGKTSKVFKDNFEWQFSIKTSFTSISSSCIPKLFFQKRLNVANIKRISLSKYSLFDGHDHKPIPSFSSDICEYTDDELLFFFGKDIIDEDLLKLVDYEIDEEFYLALSKLNSF